MQLRPMTIEDADFLLELKNYEETRRFAIASHDEIKREDHLKYLEDNIQYFQVILLPYGPTHILAGFIRIKDNEISIWINKAKRNLGIATWVLNEVAQKGHIARIVDGNVISMRCFINAGFKPIEYKDNYYIFQK